MHFWGHHYNNQAEAAAGKYS